MTRVRYKEKYLYYATSPGDSKIFNAIILYLNKHGFKIETRSMPSGAIVIRIFAEDIDKVRIKFSVEGEDVQFFKGDPFPWLKSEWAELKISKGARKRD